MIRRLCALLLLATGVVCLGVTTAHAAEEVGRVRVIEVSGYLDPIMANFIENSIDLSEKAGDEVLVIQFDSHGTLLDQSQTQSLIRHIKTSRVPVAIWIGGVGASATNGSYFVARAGDIVGVAPATAIGTGSPKLTAAQALKQNTAQIEAPVLQQFIFQLDGKVLNGKKLNVADSSATEKNQRVIRADVTFSKPTLLARFLHASSSPSMAYLFLIVGMLLIVFELYSVGVGIAAISGMLLLIPSAYGLGVLPVNNWALALLVVSVLAFTIDIQAGASRAWTAIGAVLFVVGSFFLYDGVSLPLITFIPVFLLTMIFVVTAMPSTIRSRFSLPVVGREWMIGQIATAQTAVSPDGVIDLRGGTWPARTNRATPIAAGDRVRVVSIEGLVVEVEPESGGAREAGH